jgi:hypothetical protein
VLHSTMSTVLPKSVLDYLAAYETGNTTFLDECVAPNVLYLNVSNEGGMRADGIAGVAQIIKGIHDMLADLKLTISEQHVDASIVRIAGFLDATSQACIVSGLQHGQHVHLPIRLAIKVENDRIVKLFESS